MRCLKRRISFVSAFWIAFVLGLLNTFLKPILKLLTFPITLLTFGLFLIIINLAIIWLTDRLIEGFKIDTIGAVFGFSIVTSVFTWLAELVLGLND